MKTYSVHFSPWHQLYYVIETEATRGRVIYAHAWRMCAQYVADRQGDLARGEADGKTADSPDVMALTEPNALYPRSASGAARRQSFGPARSQTASRRLERRSGWSGLRTLRRFRLRLTRLLALSTRRHDRRTTHDLAV